MAREVNEIMNSMIVVKNDQPELANLNSVSATAHWRLWIYVVAYCTWTLENLWDIYKTYVSEVANSSRIGTSFWWIDVIQSFQYGDDLQVLIDSKGKKYLGYSTIDTSKQIVKRYSISPSGNGSAFIKVAQEVSGEVEPLTTDQLTAFVYYVDKMKPPGANIGVSSNDSDLAKIYLSVYFNPLLGEDNIKTKVKDAITYYFANLGNTNFNGQILLSEILISVKKVEGVVDAMLTDAQAKSSTGVYDVIDRIYQTKAGYIQIDPDFLLDDTIEMITA